MSTKWRSDDTVKWKHGFGNGHDGSSYVVPANEGCSGTAASNTLNLAAAGTFADGDLILISQTRGTGAGNYMLNKIVSGGGTTTLTLETPLDETYIDSGTSQAQVIELKEYKNLVTGSLSAPTWDGSKGGIVAWLDKGTSTVDGTLTITGKGFRGGTGITRLVAGRPRTGYSGESYNNDVDSTGGAGAGTDAGGTVSPSSGSAAVNGAGGAGRGSRGEDGASGGGGAGYAAAGTAGGSKTGSSPTYAGGGGGGSHGAAGLTALFLGSGGGSGGVGQSAGTSGAGQRGGGIIFIASKTLIVTGSIVNKGTNGTNAASNLGGGGAGSGGSVLLKVETATLGSSLINAAGGSGGSASGVNGGGGAGAVGRIHIDYSGSVDGTTTPTLDSRLDSTIRARRGGGALYTHFL